MNGGKSMVKPNYKCLICGGCVGLCPQSAICLEGLRIVVDEKCTNCGICIKFCPVGAMEE